ncbi:hypothetical protein GS966_27755 [Rhodococcus hoagii]|nr:hypothetical protein [Prescottella equi]NKS10217.1 hypothetical protein [Prescottella equi]NKS35208.1 hypothetical protein [Prescottella equi]NKS62114.1 hypothetical protein [Prescottella equi]NKS68274.1 hypothetical protein [Prescottella equi]
MTFTTTEYAKPKRPRWVLPALGGIVVIALIAALVLALTKQDDEQPTSPASTSAPNAMDLTAAPAKLEWKLIDGVRLPYSKVDGPAKVAGPLATGYSHTPQGAVVAAWQISTRLAASADYERVMSAQVRGTEAERTQVRLEVANVRNLTPEQFSARFTQPIGFQIVSYDPTFAQMYFAVQSPDGGYDFTARAVLWDGKDWQYQLVSGLPVLPNSTSVDGFTLF